MRNYVHPGDIVTVIVPEAVNSGDGILCGALFGVAISTAAINTEMEIAITGVVDLPKAAVPITQGAKVYWDNTTKNVTTTDPGNTLIGCALEAAITGDTTVRVRLNGVVV